MGGIGTHEGEAQMTKLWEIYIPKLCFYDNFPFELYNLLCILYLAVKLRIFEVIRRQPQEWSRIRMLSNIEP